MARATPALSRHRGRLAKNPYFILLIPAGVWLAIFFVVPHTLTFLYGFQSRNPDGTIAWGFHLGNYIRFVTSLHGEFPPNYVSILIRSLGTAALSTAVCLLIGYPFAYFLASCPTRWRNLLLVLVVLPFWTNFLIRTYSWRMILWKNGILDRLAQAVGLESLVLHATPTAVIVGLVYGYLPFMILPLYVALDRQDRSLVQAAQDLGASPFAAFRKVVVPLSLPGIVAGSVLVFIPSASAFITPKLLGGAKTMMVGELIELQFKTVRDWPFGSAVGFVLMAVVLGLTTVYFRAVRAEEF